MKKIMYFCTMIIELKNNCVHLTNRAFVKCKKECTKVIFFLVLNEAFIIEPSLIYFYTMTIFGGWYFNTFIII